MRLSLRPLPHLVLALTLLTTAACRADTNLVGPSEGGPTVDGPQQPTVPVVAPDAGNGATPNGGPDDGSGRGRQACADAQRMRAAADTGAVRIAAICAVVLAR